MMPAENELNSISANDAGVLAPPAKSRALSIMNNFTLAGCVLLAVLSIWPGQIFSFFVVLLLIPTVVMGLGWIVALVEFAQAQKARRRMQSRQLLVIPAAVCATLIVLQMHLVQAAAFVTARSNFDRMLQSAPVVNSWRDPRVVDRWIGPYHLIEYAADSRGGVYFVTSRSGDGIGPDTTSYGFVYQPNSQGSPFGRKYYQPVHLFGEWYMFEASDDF